MQAKTDHQVDKLDEDNYTTWRWQLTLVLKAKKIWDVVEAPIPKNIQPTDDKLDANQQALAIIASSLSQKNKMLVVGLDNAHEVWTRLESIFEGKTSFEKQDLLSKLHCFKITTVADIAKPLSEMQTIVSKLSLLGEKVSDEALMSIIMNSLPSVFDSFLVAFKLLAPETRTLQHLISNVMARSKELDKGQTEAVAYAARFTNKKYNDKKPGYKNSGEKKPGSCNYCKKEGHWARDCRKLAYKKKKEGEGSGSGTSTNHKEGHKDVLKHVAFMANMSGFDPEAWIADSGATAHMTCDKQWLHDYQELEEKEEIAVGNGERIYAIGHGTIILDNVSIKDVYYVPDVATNLFSIGIAVAQGWSAIYKEKTVILENNEKILMMGSLVKGTWILNIKPKKISHSALVTSNWHKKLGHVSHDVIRKMEANNSVSGLNVKESGRPICTDCLLGKCTRTSHPMKLTAKAQKPGLVLHFDTIGKISPPSIGKSQFILLCKDEFSTFRMVSCLEVKGFIKDIVKQMITRTHLETNNKVMSIVTDNGSEFVNAELNEFLKTSAIVHVRSAPYTPMQNGFIEREVRTVVESARTLLVQSKMESELWAEAVNVAVYTLNRCINSKTGNLTPYELWCGKKPNVANLHIFGQDAVLLKHEAKRKFDAKGHLAKFTGYTTCYNTFRFYVPSSGKIIITSDVVFINKDKTGTSSAKPEKPKTLEQVNLSTDGPVDVNNNCVNNEASTSFSSDKTDSLPRSPFLGDHYFSSDQVTPVVISDYDETPSKQQLTPEQEIIGNYLRSPEMFRGVANSDRQLRRSERLHNIEARQLATNQSTIEQPVASASYVPASTNTNSDGQNIEGQAGFVNRHTGQQYLVPRPRVHFEDEDSQHSFKDTTEIPNVCTTFHKLLIADVREGIEPQTFKEAISRSDRAKWLEAIKEELDSMDKNEVWELVDKPENTNIVTNKWIFKIKRKADGSAPRYKARLVARGFSQVEGEDYHETFAPVANMSSLRMLFALAARDCLKMRGFDVKTAFLNGELDELVYMKQPEGFGSSSDKVCRLKRSLYGLKQSPRQWNKKFTNFLLENNLTMSDNDCCIFYRTSPRLIIAIYVDDGVILAEDEREINIVMESMKQTFEIHEVELSQFLGFEIVINSEGILLHQSAYIRKILKKYNMNDCNLADSPVQESQSQEAEETASSTVPYREAIGSLMYAAVITRIDIMFAVAKAARAVSNPTTNDWQAVKRIFRYLKGTIDLGIKFDHVSSRGMIAFCDADFAGDSKTSRSTTGLTVILAGGSIHWRSQRQKMVVLSSTEAEIVSLCATTQDVIWLRRLALEIGAIDQAPTLINCDNQSAIRLAENERSKQRTRHMAVKVEYPRDQIKEGNIIIKHVKAGDQVADFLTKPTTIKAFKTNRDKLMISKSLFLAVSICILIDIMIPVYCTFEWKFNRVGSIFYEESNKIVFAKKLRFKITILPKNPCKHFDGDSNNKPHHDQKNICHDSFRQDFLNPWKEFSDKYWVKHPEEPRQLVSDNYDEFAYKCETDTVYRQSLLTNFDDEPTEKERSSDKVVTIRSWYFDRAMGAMDITTEEHLHNAGKEYISKWGENYIIPWSMLLTQLRLKQTGKLIKNFIAYALETRKVAIKPLSELLNLIEEQNNWACLSCLNQNHTELLSIKYSDDLIEMDFIANVNDKSCKVYKIDTMDFWHLYFLEGKRMARMRYDGDSHFIYNSSSLCRKGVFKPEHDVIYEKCVQTNYTDPSIAHWSMLPNESHPFVQTTQVKFADDYWYVNCYPGNITINRHGTIRCSPETLAIPRELQFTTSDFDSLSIDNLKVSPLHQVRFLPNDVSLDPQNYGSIDRELELQQKLDECMVHSIGVSFVSGLLWILYLATFTFGVLLGFGMLRFIRGIIFIFRFIVGQCEQSTTLERARNSIRLYRERFLSARNPQREQSNEPTGVKQEIIELSTEDVYVSLPSTVTKSNEVITVEQPQHPKIEQREYFKRYNESRCNACSLTSDKKRSPSLSDLDLMRNDTSHNFSQSTDQQNQTNESRNTEIRGERLL